MKKYPGLRIWDLLSECDTIIAMQILANSEAEKRGNGVAAGRLVRMIDHQNFWLIAKK
jgi:hypothetical protein